MRKKIALGLIFAAVLVSGPVIAGERGSGNSGQLPFTPKARDVQAPAGQYQPFYGMESDRRQQGRSDNYQQYNNRDRGYRGDSSRGHGGYGGGGGRSKRH